MAPQRKQPSKPAIVAVPVQRTVSGPVSKKPSTPPKPRVSGANRKKVAIGAMAPPSKPVIVVEEESTEMPFDPRREPDEPEPESTERLIQRDDEDKTIAFEAESTVIRKP